MLGCPKGEARYGQLWRLREGLRRRECLGGEDGACGEAF